MGRGVWSPRVDKTEQLTLSLFRKAKNSYGSSRQYQAVELELYPLLTRMLSSGTSLAHLP